MKIDIKGLLFSGAVGLGLLVTGAAAQHEDHHAGQTASPAESSSAMPKMMAEQKEILGLVDRLVASQSSMEAETDPAMLKQEILEHGAMLKELQTKIQSHSHQMRMMHSMMMMMESDAKK